jgi:anti-sigma28 factor (negative regulator of flagellin synthesis)
MKINGSGSGPIRPDAAAERGKTADKTEQNGSAIKSRVDSVEISDAGRARAAESSATRSPRLQEIRERIFRGAYDTDAVVAEVARRILDRGDLQPVPSTETQ